MKKAHNFRAHNDAEISDIFSSPDGATSLFSGDHTWSATPPPQDTQEDSFPLADLAAGSAAGTSAGSTKPVGTIVDLASYLITGFWQYNITIAHHWASSTINYDISALTTAEKALAVSAMNAWQDVANVTFVQATSGAANITFNHAGSMTAFETDNYNGAGIMSSATVDISADWITTDGGARDGKTGIDSYGYQTYIHEIGHALGLGHQGPYNGNATYSTDASYANDTWQYSVMSYFAENNYNSGSYRYVTTPQMADIYAAQSIYGAAATRAGDTVYGFHNTAGSIYDFTKYTQAPALTIYDSGGNDTFDCSGYSAAQTIDLHPGSFSSVGGLIHNIGIATNTIIENATGGSGNDTLIANDATCSLNGGGGNDTLIAGAGRDTLTGGGGADTFVFQTGADSASHPDLITDFVSGQDKIDLSGFDANSATAALDGFHFLGSAAFNGMVGVLDFYFNSALGVTVLQGDTNGDRIADFAVDLTGNISIAGTDLLGTTTWTVVEASGSTSLIKADGHVYLFDSNSSGPSLKIGGNDITNQFGTWAPIGAEHTTNGYEVVWKDSTSDQYSVWNTDANGNYLSSSAVVTGADAMITSAEIVLQQDLNGDGHIGSTGGTGETGGTGGNTGNIAGTVIEANGGTILATLGTGYFLDDSTGAGPSLKNGGAAVIADQYGTWSPISAEHTSNGYEVVWKNAAADQYSIWNTNTNGNLTLSSAVVSGASDTIVTAESILQQDLNGDGHIGSGGTGGTGGAGGTGGTGGITGLVIEASGITTLTKLGTSYMLEDSTGAGPSLKNGSAAVISSQYGAWSPIGAEHTSNGYEVAWKNSAANEFSIWNTDANGNLTSSSSVVSGQSDTIVTAESILQQDLNGDGHIGGTGGGGGGGGITGTVIEANGVTTLSKSGNTYLLENGTGAGPTLRTGGSAVGADQYGTWSPISAEKTADGYEVAWKNAAADQFSIWNTDATGNLISSSAIVSGQSATITSLEASFQQDINSDGHIGVAAPVLDTTLPDPLSSLVGHGDFHI